jgi:S-adenosylmethionine:tRNA ribosyltransferase-isomerase
MKLSQFDYPLPRELVAQAPAEPRDSSRLMVLSREDGDIEHRCFFELIHFLHPGDVLVFNDSRVVPARLLGRKANGGGKVEILLLHRLEPNVWEALLRPAKRLGKGTRIEVGDEDRHLSAEVLEREEGVGRVRLSDEGLIPVFGKVAPPPYIHLPLDDPERYQTVYARVEGSVAAPTAGLHFTPQLLSQLKKNEVEFAFVTLHVGLGSFQPVRAEDVRQHKMHREYCELSPKTASRLSRAKAEGRRIIAVGTTAARVLEQAALLGEKSNSSPLPPFKGWNDLFILPGHRFRVVDALITNFHLPRSTLLMLVSAFAGEEFIGRAYKEAMRLGYRFYSFGDAMLIL